MTSEIALTLVNALKAFQEGHTDIAENLAPGFCAEFFSLTPAARSSFMGEMLTALQS